MRILSTLPLSRCHRVFVVCLRRTLQCVLQYAISGLISRAARCDGLHRRMKHPNLVQLIGVSATVEPIMIVSEYMAKVCSSRVQI